MRIHIRAGDIHLTHVRTRMPFKYGIATMTEAPHAFVRLRVEIDGRLATGVAADHLPPKWFTKEPQQSLDDEVAEMLRVIRQAVRRAPGTRAESAFAAWRQLWEAQAAWGRAEKLPPLLVHFGTALVERAMLEAVCRAAGRPFHQLLHANTFGVRLGDIHPELAGRAPADFLPENPLPAVLARHTVGLADPLQDADIGPDERLDDGLPQSLEASIRAYGLRHFKVKVSGNLDRDRERLGRLAQVIGRVCGVADYALSMDGNEQFHSLAAFREFWQNLERTEALLPLFGHHLLFVEQPFHRDVALRAEVLGSLRDWRERPPLIIDESDADLDSLPQALRLGYHGTSHKNCKGVFKGIANACLLAHLRREQPAGGFVSSGEDLANIGPVALLQDLAVCAALGIESVERNGHHYFAGLSMFPPGVQRQVAEAHPDLYRASRDGWPTLTLRDGTLRLGSVNAAALGVGPAIDVEQFAPLDA